MNGIKYVFDTNALISFFQGNPHLSQFTSSASLGISVISVLEFLSFSSIDDNDKNILFAFIKKVEVIDLKKDDYDLINSIADIRTTFKVKLPDAIIAATAIYKNAVLVTNDRDFSKITSLQILSY